MNEPGRENRGEPDLLKAARQGDAEAFGQLVDLYRDRVYGVAFRIVGNAEDAMDIAQDAFVKAWKSLPRFRGGSAFFTWIYRITVNLSLDHLRRRRPETAGYDDALLHEDGDGAGWAPAAAATPDREAERAEIRARVEKALEDLSPEQRTVFVLREFEGLSYREIAAAMRCRIGTVMSRLHYARQRMRELLGDMT